MIIPHLNVVYLSGAIVCIVCTDENLFLGHENETISGIFCLL